VDGVWRAAVVEYAFNLPAGLLAGKSNLPA
jgi:hypothetical protein